MDEHEENVASIYDKLIKALDEAKQVKQAYEAEQKKKRGRPSDSVLASKIARWMSGFCTAFKGSNGAMYVRVEHPKYPQYNRTVPLSDVGPTDATLHDLIGKMYEEETNNLVKIPIRESACAMFLSDARVNAGTIDTAIRVAHAGAGGATTIYIDRGISTESDRYIKVTRDNVSVGNDSGDFYFVREGNTGELPVPDMSSTYSTLPPLLTLTEEDKRTAFLWCMQTLLPLSAYVNLAIDAPSGSGKSTLVAYLRGITDPHKDFLTEIPLPDRLLDFMVKGVRTHVLSYDNLSVIPDWFSENACRVSKGTEVSVKTLYTTTGLTEIRTKNPLIFSGIHLMPIMKGDLIRRSLMLKLPPRSRNTDSTEAKLAREFEAIHPQLLGALLNAVRGALVHIDELREDFLGNMPEFRRWSIAAGIELEWTEAEIDELISKYQDPRRDSDEITSVFLKIVVLFLSERSNEDYEYYDTPGRLLYKLRELYMQVSHSIHMPPDFPVDATRCVKALRDAEDILYRQNIVVLFNTDHSRDGNRLYMKLVKAPESSALDNFVRNAMPGA